MATRIESERSASQKNTDVYFRLLMISASLFVVLVFVIVGKVIKKIILPLKELDEKLPVLISPAQDVQGKGIDIVNKISTKVSPLFTNAN